MKFQVTFEVKPDDTDAEENESFAEGIEAEVEGALMDLGYSNIEAKAV